MLGAAGWRPDIARSYEALVRAASTQRNIPAARFRSRVFARQDKSATCISCQCFHLLVERERPDRHFGTKYFFRACLTFIRRSEEHTSELQSRRDLVCRLLLEKKKKKKQKEKRNQKQQKTKKEQQNKIEK